MQGDDLPEKVLFTETWRLVIPALYNRCPDCMLALDASVTAPPVTYFDATRGITSSGESAQIIDGPLSELKSLLRAAVEITTRLAFELIYLAGI